MELSRVECVEDEGCNYSLSFEFRTRLRDPTKSAVLTIFWCLSLKWSFKLWTVTNESVHHRIQDIHIDLQNWHGVSVGETANSLNKGTLWRIPGIYIKWLDSWLVSWLLSWLVMADHSLPIQNLILTSCTIDSLAENLFKFHGPIELLNNVKQLSMAYLHSMLDGSFIHRKMVWNRFNCTYFCSEISEAHEVRDCWGRCWDSAASIILFGVLSLENIVHYYSALALNMAHMDLPPELSKKTLTFYIFWHICRRSSSNSVEAPTKTCHI